MSSQCLPCSKHKTLTQCCFDVGSPSSTSSQHQNNTESVSRVCWVSSLAQYRLDKYKRSEILVNTKNNQRYYLFSSLHRNRQWVLISTGSPGQQEMLSQCWFNVGQSRRWWTSFKPTSGQHIVFAAWLTCEEIVIYQRKMTPSCLHCPVIMTVSIFIYSGQDKFQLQMIWRKIFLKKNSYLLNIIILLAECPFINKFSYR